MNRWKCHACDETKTTETRIHLHEVRSHSKPEKNGGNGIVGGPWDRSRNRAPSLPEWAAVWTSADRLRRERHLAP